MKKYDSKKKYKSLEKWFCAPHLSLRSIPSIILCLKLYTLKGIILPSDNIWTFNSHVPWHATWKNIKADPAHFKYIW